MAAIPSGIWHIILSTLPFIVTIGVLVTAHEFGHFITARIFGMHVPVFSVGMGRRLFGFSKLFGFTFGPLKPEQEEQLGVNTDYRLALLPIGGYAKIDGMIDETQTTELSPIVQPWEFRAKSWWKKSIVICAGVVMNLIVATLIFTGLEYRQGETVKSTREIGYVLPTSESARQGITAGDQVAEVNGSAVENWTELESKIYADNLGKDFSITFKTRQGPKVVHYAGLNLKDVDDEQMQLKLDENLGLFPVGTGPVEVEAAEKKPAIDLGLKSGDVITKVNDDTVPNRTALITFISRHPNDPISVSWLRKGVLMSGKVTPDGDGHIGISVMDQPYHGPEVHKEYSIFESVPKGISLAAHQMGLIVHGIWMTITGKVPVTKALGGPIKIFKYANQSASYGGSAFVIFIAMLSLSLAFLNILPIPALDGGHLIIILIEAVLHRELSLKLKLGIQKVGVALLLTLMAFMVFNDIRSL